MRAPSVREARRERRVVTRGRAGDRQSPQADRAILAAMSIQPGPPVPAAVQEPPRRAPLGVVLSAQIPSRVLILAICGILAGIGLALYDSVRAERAARAQVALTSEVLRLLRTSLRTGLEAETGQRGFLLTGDESYLSVYLAAEDSWLDDIDALGAVLEDIATEGQLEALGEIRSIAEAKLAELERTVELARAGERSAALEVVETGEGQRLMRRFRERVSELEDAEQDILRTALGHAVAVEGRTVPILLVLGAAVLGLVALGLRLERRAARAEAEAREAEALRRAHERSDLLARELNHRVKNLFAVITSIVSMSGRGETDVKVAVRKIRDRIHALSLAHAVSQGQLDAKVVALEEVLRATLEPYMGADASRVTLDGPPLRLPVKSVTPVGLIAHELATNAAKYGALSRPEGRVEIGWTLEAGGAGDGTLRLSWRERGGPPAAEPAQEGFGSVMLTQAARQLGGSVERRWTDEGLEAVVAFPAAATGAA